MIKRLLRHFFLYTIASSLAASCVATGYWIPPSAAMTAVPGSYTLYAEALDTPAPTSTSSLLPFPTTSSSQPAVNLLFLPSETPLPLTPLSNEMLDPLPTTLPSATPEQTTVNDTPYLYYAQAADTLSAVAVRFGVQPAEITSPDPLEEEAFLTPGQLLVIPRRLANTTSSKRLLPDSEVVYSPTAIDFNLKAYVQEAGGKLSVQREWLRSTGELSGAEVVMRVSIENSINPRLLLALLEYHSGWVTGQPADAVHIDYPLGKQDPMEKGLYKQLVWAVNQLSIGYYAYREGRLTEIHFSDGMVARLAPDLNAGTAALQYYFAQSLNSQGWVNALDEEAGFPALYSRMFGDPWERANTVEPLFPAGIEQPPLILPFARNWVWAFTGGPHGAWEHDGAYAALDFGPGSMLPNAGCVESDTWVVAAASGLVVRSGNGVVVIDLDGDGYEQTGWVLVYLHIATKDRIPAGAWVDMGDEIGHASCEGGVSTGTHIHIARKFNGEWIPAAGPLPFNLGGWIAHAGPAAYKGTLTRNGQTVTACTCSSASTFILRGNNDP